MANIAIVEATEFDDDPIQDFSSSPFEGSRQAQRRRNTVKVAKRRKPLNKLQQNILKPEVDELSNYKLPNAYGMSPNTKKRLKMSMICSDGFDGRESQPTGRTMPMRLPRRHPQVFGQTFARVPELTLASSRELTENIGGTRRLQREQLQYHAITMFSHEESDIVTATLAPLMQHLPGSLQDRNELPRPEGTSQLGKGTKLIPIYDGDSIDTEESRMVEAPATICRPKRRVTFSEDVKALQALTMVSAPIAMTSSYDSDDSESGTTDDGDDDDRSSSGSSDEDRNEGAAEGGSDDQRGSEEGNSDTEIDVEGEGALQLSTASVKATFQSPGHTEEYLEENELAEARDSQRLALNDDFVRRKSVYNAGIIQNISPPYPLYSQSFIEQEKALITGGSRQQHKITEDDPWRPRRPVSTRRLIEVDDDILDYPNSPTENLRSGDERRPFLSASARKIQVQSYDDRASSEFMEDLQERKQSQGSVELGDPNWSVPYGHEDEQSYSQAQNPDYPAGEFHRYDVVEYPTYLARALDSFSNPSQGSFSLARSKSRPINYPVHCTTEKLQEESSTGNLEISPAFKRTVSPLKRSLSQMQSTDLRALTRRMSIEAGTTPARGWIQSLSFKPPFLRD